MPTLAHRFSLRAKRTELPVVQEYNNLLRDQKQYIEALNAIDPHWDSGRRLRHHDTG